VPLTAQDVAEITRLLEESDFEELSIEHEGFKLTLKRRAGDRDPTTMAAAASAARWSASRSTPGPAAGPVAQAATVAAQAGTVSAQAATVSARAAADACPPGPAGDSSLLDVTAPLLGIFYRAPRPGAAPFVEVGAQIREDTVIGIIEVMKLMNSVRAEVRGTVVEILVEDGAMVEYGQVLLRVSRGGQSG